MEIAGGMIALALLLGLIRIAQAIEEAANSLSAKYHRDEIEKRKLTDFN